MQSEDKFWDKISKVYEDKFMNILFYNDSYDFFCKQLPPNAKIFEVGCGPGNITFYLNESRSDFQIFATDYSEKMVALARVNVPQGKFEVLDGRKLEKIKETFQGIVAGFIVPYFTKAETNTFFETCEKLLSSKGILYFSFVEGNENDSCYKTDINGYQLFFRYFEKAFMLDGLKKSKFQILEEFKIQYARNENESEEHTVFIAQKNN